jgi:3-oxoacyl-[acyl-carrier-protein] synthase-3
MAPVYITGVAAVLPNEPVSNDDMETVLGRVGGRRSRARSIVLRNNGIKSRHYVIDKATGKPTCNNAQLTAQAVRRLADEVFSLDDLELLCCGTSSPDQWQPNHAVMVHGELGNPPCEVTSMAGICVSGVSALKYGWLSVLSGQTRNAVATGSEVASTYMLARNFEAESDFKVDALGERPEIAFEKDFLRWMLSDGAGAVRLQDAPNATGISLRVEWIEQRSFANELETCMYGGAEKGADGKLIGWREYPGMEDVVRRGVFSIKQDVKLLNENIVPFTVERALPAFAQKHGLRPEDVDWFLPHMSSEYFRDRLAEGLTRCGFSIPQTRWFTNLATKGNTGSASIYIMLDELFRSGRLIPGQRLLCFIPESGRFSTAFMLLTVV